MQVVLLVVLYVVGFINGWIGNDEYRAKHQTEIKESK